MKKIFLTEKQAIAISLLLQIKITELKIAITDVNKSGLRKGNKVHDSISFRSSLFQEILDSLEKQIKNKKSC